MQFLSNRISDGIQTFWYRRIVVILSILALAGLQASSAFAQAHDGGQGHQPGGEANLKLPNLSQVKFFGGLDGHTLLGREARNRKHAAECHMPTGAERTAAPKRASGSSAAVTVW